MRLKYKFLFIVIILLAVIVCGTIVLTCCTKSDFEPEHQSSVTEEKYKLFAEQWNQYAKIYSPSFELFGERGGLDSNIIAALNRWLVAFQEMPEDGYLKELSTLEAEVGQTTFHQWENFKKAHYRQQPLILNTEMNPQQTAIEINKYIGVSYSNPQDYISRKTVQTVIFMNSFCAFFEAEKNNLHKNGIDTRIHSCNALSTKGRYPSLDAKLK